ncbi:hypothetical protein RQP46_006802 [Phenoliferia psychrophenolica]
MTPIVFDAHTTAEQAALTFESSIAGKTILITGASPGGLGFETARVLAKAGAGLIILAGRSREKLDEASIEIKKETSGANLRNLVVDLASLESVRRAAAEVNAYEEHIDVLINNAGIMAGPFKLTIDGFESTFASNHLGHFLLTNLIRSRLVARPRIVNVSSLGHQFSDIRYDDLDFSHGERYDKWAAYAVWTPLVRFLSDEDLVGMGFVDEHGNRITEGGPYTFKSLQAGASTAVVAAFDPSLSGTGFAYLHDARVANDKAQPYAADKENAQRLWALSEKLVGQTFP